MIVLVGNNEWTDRKVKGLDADELAGEVKKQSLGSSACLM
jgi:hypothetical protein